MAKFLAVFVFGALLSVTSRMACAIDEVEFLQTEVVTYAANAGADDAVLDESAKVKGAQVCQDFNDGFKFDMPCAPLVQDTILNAIPSNEEMTENEVGDRELKEHALMEEEHAKTAMPFSSQTASSVLVWCLDVLVLLIIADGIKRWHNKDAPSTSKSHGFDNFQTFMQAALAGDMARCETMLATGVDVRRTDAWGCTVLHAAASGGSGHIVKRLIECGSNVEDVDSWDEIPLHMAARAGHTDVCELLIAHGSPINALNAQNQTPLVTAAQESREQTCRFLLSRKAGVGGLADSELPMMLFPLLTEKILTNEMIPPGLGDSLLNEWDEEDEYTKLVPEDEKNTVEAQCRRRRGGQRYSTTKA